MILAMKTEYSNILQSVESDEEILDGEWKSINWWSIGYSIFKIQRRIFEAEKAGDYRKVNSLCRLLVNDKRSILYGIYVVTKRNKGKRTSGIDNMVIKQDYERMALFYKLCEYKISLHNPKPVRRIYIPKKNTSLIQSQNSLDQVHESVHRMKLRLDYPSYLAIYISLAQKSNPDLSFYLCEP